MTTSPTKSPAEIQSDNSTAVTVKVEGSIYSHAFSIIHAAYFNYDSSIELFVRGDPHQVLLYFSTTEEFKIEEIHSGFVSLFVPRSRRKDILYLLKTWPRRTISMRYNPETKQVTYFNLSACNEVPGAKENE